MEKIFELLDEKNFDAAISLIKENLSKRDQNFIEDLVPSLNIITSSSIEVVEAIMTSLLGILNIDDDVIRYSIILSLRSFVIEHKELIFPYIEDYLKYGTPKKREGMLLLVKYIADTDPKALKPYYKLLAYELSDSVDYIRKKAIEILQAIGKVDRHEIEACIFDYLKAEQEESAKKKADEELLKEADKIMANLKEAHSIQPQDKLVIDVADKILKKGSEGASKRADKEEITQAADIVLKNIIDIKGLSKEELEKKQKEAQSKAFKQKLLEDKKKLELERLQLEAEKEKIDEERLKQEKDRLEKERTLLEKKMELSQVKQEFELKRIEEEKNKIIEEEQKRIQKKLKELEKLEANEKLEKNDKIGDDKE
ncbi:MAG: hypothetical protein ACTSXK_02880 [Promethearchaeota archaeon]